MACLSVIVSLLSALDLNLSYSFVEWVDRWLKSRPVCKEQISSQETTRGDGVQDIWTYTDQVTAIILEHDIMPFKNVYSNWRMDIGPK